MGKIIGAFRARLRGWLGIVYLDKHLSRRLRELEAWRDSCIVAVPVDAHFKSKDIIILAGRFGAEDRVKILSVEFKDLREFVDLAKRLEQSIQRPRFYWDGPLGFSDIMRKEIKR